MLVRELSTLVGTGPLGDAHTGILRQDCSWWNLLCQGGHAVADSGLSAITKSISSGVGSLLGQIVRVIDGSTQVPLADPTYRSIYFGFLGLAAPLVAVVLLGALVVAGVKRDPGTFTRAVSGLVVACLGGALYIAMAQLLVALDNWLSHGIVRVTGHNIVTAMTHLEAGFTAITGSTGDMAANMLMIVLMLVMLIAGLGLWFVLVLRKIAILVVVAFAPLLIVGWLWAPTRSWSRRATEVTVALVFTKSALYALFGIGMALLFRDNGQSLSDFVGAVILLCGACFAPLAMLKLVHFAADSHIAGEMMGTLRGGLSPVTERAHRAATAGATMGRHEMARHFSNNTASQTGGGQQPRAGSTLPLPRNGSAGEARSTPAAAPAAGAGAQGASGSGGGTAAAGGAVAGVALAAKTGVDTAKKATQAGSSALDRLANDSPGSTRSSNPDDVRLSGPSAPDQDTSHDGGL
ncbi:MAG: hypothetical protein ACRDPG_11890 [Nocardioidaceae bacterium]